MFRACSESSQEPSHAKHKSYVLLRFVRQAKYLLLRISAGDVLNPSKVMNTGNF